MCEFMSKFPAMCYKMERTPVQIMRGLIEKSGAGHQVGQLWNYMAQMFIRLGQFGLARDIFEEALDVQANGVQTVRDFVIVFNSYVKFEKTLLRVDHNIDIEDGFLDQNVQEFKLQRIENLLQRRPFLLSDVVLAENPNDVGEWMNRLKLCPEDEKA